MYECILCTFLSKSWLQTKKEENKEKNMDPDTGNVFKCIGADSQCCLYRSLLTWSSLSCCASACSTKRPTHTLPLRTKQQKWDQEHHVLVLHWPVLGAVKMFIPTYLFIKYSLWVCARCHIKRERTSNDVLPWSTLNWYTKRSTVPPTYHHKLKINYTGY